MNDETKAADVFTPEIVVNEPTVNNPPPEGNPAEGGQPTGQPANQPAQAPLTAESITQAVQAGIQSQQPAQQPMSQDEINQHLKVWNPDEDFANSLVGALTPNDEGQINPAGLVKVLQNMHQAQMAQSQTYAQALAHQQTQQFQGQIQPLNQHYAQAQQDSLHNEFATSYPALKQFANLIPVAAQALRSQGGNYTDKAQLFPALATTMEQLVKQVNPQFSLQGAGKPGGQGGVTPATLASGNQGGGGHQTASQNGSASIWK